MSAFVAGAAAYMGQETRFIDGRTASATTVTTLAGSQNSLRRVPVQKNGAFADHP